jgi:hypothetical protein
MDKLNKVVVRPFKEQGNPSFEVFNHHSDIFSWNREQFIKELQNEVLKGNVVKVIDESMKNKLVGKNYIDDIIAHTFVFKKDKKYEAIKIMGPKKYFTPEERAALSSMKSTVKNLRFSRNIKKLVVGATLVAGLALGTAHYVNNNEEAKSKLDKVTYNVSVKVEDSFRSRGLYDLMLADLYKISINERGDEFITPYSAINFESPEQSNEFVKSVQEEYETRIEESNLKRILDNNEETEVFDKYYGLIETFRANSNNDPEIADNVFNSLTAEERVALSEYKNVFSKTISDLAEEKGLSMGYKGNVR